MTVILKTNQHWFGNVECSSGAVRTACDIQIDGRQEPGRLKLTWKKLMEKDCHEWKLTTVDPQERSTLRSGVRSAMRAASQLPVRGPLMWMMPLHLHVNQKSDYDDDDRQKKHAKFPSMQSSCYMKYSYHISCPITCT